MREHLEVINHSHAIDFVEALAQHDEPITESVIRQIHALILRTIDDDNAGGYRRGNVRIVGSMRDFGEWLVSAQAQKLHAVEVAARAHFTLVDIYPFIDGNGRTARLLMNLILMRSGFPPTVIRMEERQKYYDALDQAHSGDLHDFIGLVADAVERSLDVYLDALPRK